MAVPWTWVGAAVALLVFGGAAGLSCGPCEPAECSVGARTGCRGGLTADPCGCCPVCARTVNETCGGDFHILGRCDRGLKCVITPGSKFAITGHEPGTCQVDEDADAFVDDAVAVPAALTSTSCQKAKCNVGRDPKCPKDSTIMGGKILPGHCCPELPFCQCKPCLKPPDTCPEDHIKLHTAKGVGKPGQCCDVYECKSKEEVCAAVKCEEFAPLGCPDDSFRPEPIPTHNGCCLQPQGCVCKPSDLCEVPECLEGQRLTVVTPATGQPGECCNQLECANDTSTCIFKEKEMEEGSSWQIDACRTCTCDHGIAFCMSIKCETPGYCSWVGLPEKECCPVCKGCIGPDGEHPNGSTWLLPNDPCVRCTCERGHVRCRAFMCDVKCSHPRHVEGQCCPICDEEDSSITWPPECPVLQNCSLLCQNGLERDEAGCYICKCQPVCPLECPHGYMLDSEGKEMCECAVSPPVCKSMDRCKKQCAYGLRINKHGCQRCRCQKCPPFHCKKKCMLGYQENVNGCKLCKCRSPDSYPTPTSKTLRPSHGCMSTRGHYMEEGEVWHDGCRRCFCHGGREMCALITCPAPRCHNPVMRIKDCCPTCHENAVAVIPGEATRCQAQGGEYHAEGETWQLDSCTQCLCHGGDILCEIESCAPVLCHHPVKLTNSCCPVCPDAPPPPAEERQSCHSTSGTKFDDGDSWRVNACQSCMCQNGQIHCFSQTCIPLSCNKTVLRKGQCCPHCIDEEEPRTCFHEGEEYGPGEHWIVGDCTKCVCDNGHSMCASIRCPVLTSCPRLIKLQGVCCPICHNSTILSTVSTTEVSPKFGQPRDWDNHFPEAEGSSHSNQVAVGVLVTAVVLLLMLVVVLLILLVYTRRRAHPLQPKSILHPMHAVSDVPLRPKSTNVKFQGCSPLPSYADSVKMANWSKPPSAALKGDKNFRYSSAEDKTAKIVLDLPYTEDPNNFRKSM